MRFCQTLTEFVFTGNFSKGLPTKKREKSICNNSSYEIFWLRRVVVVNGC
jgi:hypothetical protein